MVPPAFQIARDAGGPEGVVTDAPRNSGIFGAARGASYDNPDV
jgi:hypothetical protein